MAQRMPDYGYGGYSPGSLYPGGTESRPQYINRPAPTLTGGPVINGIEQRWRAIQASGNTFDPAIQDFLGADCSRLIAIAQAAYRLANATNAEASRQASQTLYAVLRQPL